MHRAFGTGLCLLCLLAAAEVSGQSQYDVVVKSAFSPVIQDAQKKLTFPARISDSVAPRPTMDYSLQVRPYKTRFEPDPIIAPRVGKDKISRLYRHSVKAGFGYLQPLLAYDFNSLRSTHQAFGAHVYSHASFDQVKDCAPSSYAENTVALYAEQYRPHFVLREEASYAFDWFHCYGYPADSLKKRFGWSQSASDNVRSYHRAHAGMMAYTPATKKNVSWQQRYAGSYDLLYDNYHSVEHQLYAEAGLDKRLMVSRVDMLRVGGVFTMQYGHNDWRLSSRQADSWVFNLHPRMQWEEGNLKLDAGAALSVGLLNSESSVALFPKVNATWNLVPGVLAFYAGADGEMDKDSYQAISLENPFLIPELDLGIDRIYRLYVGTKTNLSQRLAFGARIGWENHTELDYFMPDTSVTAWVDTNRIRLYHQFDFKDAAASLAALHVDAAYRYKELFSIKVDFDYYSYMTADTVTLYYRPQYVLGISADYSLKQKVNIGLSAVWKDEMYTPVFEDGKVVGKEELPLWFDLSLNAEYLWSNRLRFFVDLNNLLGRSNPMYAYYRTERFNCLFGLKYIFGGE
ncbi:MAG: hypothetical protein J5873_00340 [Bacteroidales bacterium]|nr:hypothetical protein [Bacteroidales bacterium]